MAISGGSYRVENDLQQSFSSNMTSQNDIVNSTVGAYSSSNVSDDFMGIGARDGSANSYSTVGIKEGMVDRITGVIDAYINDLKTTLDSMPTAVNYTQGFQGTGVVSAVENFVTNVKNVCNTYITNLQNAENQIVESVYAQYSASDQDLAGQVNSDTSAISGGEAPTGAPR